jgi:hypothetical protein
LVGKLMKAIFTFALLAALIFLIPRSQAQGVIQQFGSLIAGDNIMSQGNNRAVDAGNSSVPTLPGTRPVGVGVINSGFGFCQWNPDPGANTIFSTFCTGFNSNGNGLIYFNSPSGKGLQFVINGTSYPFPGTPVNITGYAVVANNVALKALIVTPGSQVYRQGFYAAGDGGAAAYTFSATACSINSGSGDNGLQVEPTSASGCFNAYMPPAGLTPLVWGAIGNGTTDDTTPVLAACYGLAGTGIPLLLNTHPYFISTGCDFTTTTGNPVIYGSATGGIYTRAPCATGLITNSNIFPITVNSSSGVVRDVCIQLAPSPGMRGDGGGILIAGTSSNYTSGVQITGNVILYGYQCIIDGGATNGSPYQTNGTLIADNKCIDPIHIGGGEGLTSTNRSTVGADWRNNQIACFSANSASVGFEASDSAFSYEGGDNGPYACNIGTELTTGTGQSVIPKLTGVLGDSNLTYTLLVTNTSASAGGIANIQADGIWTAGAPALITNPNGVNTWRNFTFVDWSAQSPTAPIVDIEGGAYVKVEASDLCSENNATGPEIKVNAVATSPAVAAFSVSLLGNEIENCAGAFTQGVQLIGNGPGSGLFKVQNNTIGNATPLVYTPNGETAIISNNLGIDNIVPGVVDAAQITIPPGVNGVRITGTGTPITDIINSNYSGRNLPFTAYFAAATTFATTGSTGTKFCGFAGPYNYAAGSSSAMSYDNADGCWAHNP